MDVLGRYRNLIILVGVLFLQVLGLAVQVKRGSTEGQDTRLIRLWAVGAVSPFERVLVWAQRGTGDIWHNYIYLRGVRAENRELKEQIEQMRLDQVRLSEDAAQARRLQSLLAFKEQFIAKTVAAQVIGSSGVDTSRVIYIDKGENAGIRRDMAVITANGIVGKVLLVYPTVAQVLLISDQSSGVGVLLGNSRLQGVLAGTANGEVTLNGVMSDEQVPLGETVLTSGGDQIFPKGLNVGTVSKVSPGKELFLNIKIKPAADLSQLEEVLVLTEKQERQATADNNVRVRAADILAQRLPSVPDKPADAATPAGGTAGASKPVANGTSVTGTKPEAANLTTPNASTANQATAKPATGAKSSGTAASQQASASSLQSSSQKGSPQQSPAPKPASKPKTADAAPAGTKPAIELDPAAADQKPASATPASLPPAIQSNPQPPADSNSPQ